MHLFGHFTRETLFRIIRIVFKVLSLLRQCVCVRVFAMNDKDAESLFNVVNLPSEYEKSNFFGKFVYLLSIDFAFVRAHSAFHPLTKLSFFSLLAVARWQWRFYLRNYRKAQIKLKDIPARRKGDDAHRIYKNFERLWNDEVAKARQQKRKPNLFWPIMRQYGTLCWVLSIVSICAVGSRTKH